MRLPKLKRQPFTKLEWSRAWVTIHESNLMLVTQGEIDGFKIYYGYINPLHNAIPVIVGPSSSVVKRKLIQKVLGEV